MCACPPPICLSLCHFLYNGYGSFPEHMIRFTAIGVKTCHSILYKQFSYSKPPSLSLTDMYEFPGVVFELIPPWDLHKSISNLVSILFTIKDENFRQQNTQHGTGSFPNQCALSNLSETSHALEKTGPDITHYISVCHLLAMRSKPWVNEWIWHSHRMASI